MSSKNRNKAGGKGKLSSGATRYRELVRLQFGPSLTAQYDALATAFGVAPAAAAAASTAKGSSSIADKPSGSAPAPHTKAGEEAYKEAFLVFVAHVN